MKSVLLSIKPRYCGLIASGKKTAEIRKTRPKLDTPFKAYIYQTKTVYVSKSKENDWLVPIKQRMGKVIGEFVCDDIYTVAVFDGLLYSTENSQPNKSQQICLTINEINQYLGEKNRGYAWHISDLVIYDIPMELGEFGLSRPPQSWCYVEEVPN